MVRTWKISLAQTCHRDVNYVAPVSAMAGISCPLQCRRPQRQSIRVGSRQRIGVVVRAEVLTKDPDSRPRPGEKKGFVEEMRFAAMKLHTRDQAPKEGQQPAHEQWNKVQYSTKGYLQYLAESKAVYDALERIVEEASHPEFKLFQQTGLERSAALAKDLKWFEEERGLKPVPLKPDGPGLTYAKLLEKLAKEDPSAFMCHFYNIYFAHSAGGRMIGVRLSDQLLDRKKLAFYEYEGGERGDKPLLEVVAGNLNKVAESWPRDVKDHCLEETLNAFKYAGGLLGLIRQDPADPAAA